MSTAIFLSETRERFLKAIIAQLPVERVRELYVFPPIRQSGVESGVAVVAAYPEGAIPPAGDAAAAEAQEVDAHAGAADAPHDAAEAGEITADDSTPEPSASEENPTDAVTSDQPPASEPGDESAEADAPAEPQPPAPEAKYTVYSARYRLVLKGPDRGKWEATVVAEADAPLISIETVVRGVQRRAGDVDPPDHMTADDLRGALRLGGPAAPGAP